MNLRAYYAKRMFWLLLVVVGAWTIWTHQKGIGRAMEGQLEPAKVGKGTFIQREYEALTDDSERGRRR